MIELPYGKKNYDNMLSRFHLIPERHGQTDRRTHNVRQTDLLYQYRTSGTIFNDRQLDVQLSTRSQRE